MRYTVTHIWTSDEVPRGTPNLKGGTQDETP